jgi:hypothetical protein
MYGNPYGQIIYWLGGAEESRSLEVNHRESNIRGRTLLVKGHRVNWELAARVRQIPWHQVALRKTERHTRSRKRVGGCDGGREINARNEGGALVLLDF